MAHNSSGITPPSDPSTQERRSRSSYEDTAMVPAVSTIVRARTSRHTPDNPTRRGPPPSTDSSIRSVSPNRRTNQRVGNMPASSSQSDPRFGDRMNLPQASFVAGAAVQQAHHASQLAYEASNAAENFQRESHEAQRVTQQVIGLAQHREQMHEAQMNQLAQEANLRHQSTVAEAEAAVARTQSQAREFVENTISSAQQAVGRSEQELQHRAQQYVREQENNLRAGMEQELSRLRGEAQDELARRERRIAELEARLHQQEVLVASNSPVPKSVPVTPKALTFTPQTQTGQVPFGSPPSNRSQHNEFPNPFACPQTGMGDQIAPPHSGPQQPPQGHPVAFQPPGFPGGMYGSLQMNPCSGSPQNGATSIDIQKSMMEELLRTRQLFDDFVNAMQPIMDVLTPEQREQIANSSGNPGFLAPPPPIAAPMQAPGSVSGAASQGAPPPMQIFPPGLPPLPLGQAQFEQPNVASGCGGGGSPSSSSSSSSSGPTTPTSRGHSSGQRPAPFMCPNCGGMHDYVNCPYLTMNVGIQPPRDYAQEEEDTIRVKGLQDLVIPTPPTDAGQARGYTNQVFLAVGKLQKTPTNEVYLWIQEVLTKSESELTDDPSFPRLDRELAAKLVKTCRKGHFGLLFQQMVEVERTRTGGMPCGRVMLKKILSHFQLERDRLGMLGERNLLTMRLMGSSVQDLENFRDKYQYILTTIPVLELPRPQTMYNHLMDELERCTVLAPKITKSREAPVGHRRKTCEWLWKQVELLISLEQQKKNRIEFDKQLKLKPQVLTSSTSSNVPANAAPTKAPPAPKAPKPDKPPKKSKAEKKKEKEVKAQAEAHALAAAAKAKAKAAKVKPPPPPKNPGPPKTPRSANAAKTANMTAAEKAKVPCMFYAYNSCRAAKCAFLHSDTNKYKGPPPRALSKGPPKAPATMAQCITAFEGAALAHQSDVFACAAQPDNGKIPWLWDTAAGRHLIGRQALTEDMKRCLQPSQNPVAFSTGGGPQPSQDSLGFRGSAILKDEEVYVLKECPPAQSIGKTVIDKGYMFVWDPREKVPYLIAPENIKRCRMRVPRNARICASRVVEYVPQYDEEIDPIPYKRPERLSPIQPVANPAESKEVIDVEETAESAEASRARALEASEREIDEFLEEYGRPSESSKPIEVRGDDLPEPSLADPMDVANLEDVAGPSQEGAAPSAPPAEEKSDKHPLDDKLLADLADGDPTKERALRRAAEAPEHLRSHFPKNPFCKICRIAKDTSMRVSRKPDGKSDDMLDPPKEPFEQLATDDVILAKGAEFQGTGIGGIKTHHVVRDLFSGARLAYPLSKRDAPSHAKNFRHFVGLRANELATKTLIKLDEAGELEQAAHQVGFIPEASLPNRWPHNALLERDIREEKECCRSIHLQSGLPYEYHTYSYPFACLSMSIDRPSINNPEKTQWEALTKSPFEGIRLCFGQLVYYRRKHPTKKTLEPNMAPGLFMGWRVDSGLRYRCVVRVMDYQEFRTKSNAMVMDVPEPELFIEEGNPIFPIAEAKRKALLGGGSEDEPLELKMYDLKEVPFPVGGGEPSPSTPSGPKSRSVYITVERILKFKETPGCKGCLGTSRLHTDDCRRRFASLVEAEKKEALDRREEPAAPEGAASSAPGASPEVPASVVELKVQKATTYSNHMLQCTGRKLPRFGRPKSFIPACMASKNPLSNVSQRESQPSSSSSSQFSVPNRRHRKKIEKRNGVGPSSPLFEFACDPESQMGITSDMYGVPHVRLSREFGDLTDPEVIVQLDYQIRESPMAPNLWGAIPCTSGSPWQYINSAKGGAAFQAYLRRQVTKSKRMFASFRGRAELVLARGGTVTFEWPRHNTGWERNDVKEFFDTHPEFHEVLFDGCAVGMRAKDGNPIKKPWKLMTTSKRIKSFFENMRCNHHPSEHTKAAGSETSRTAFYPPEMTELIVRALYLDRVFDYAPAMPCVHPRESPHEHREIEQHLRHVSALSGLDDLAVAIESDETAHSMVSELLDLEALLGNSLSSNPEEVHLMVTKLLSRTEMLNDPRALKAIREEADGLETAGTWDLNSVREHQEVKDEARESGVSVHFGQLMTIASIKFFELAQHLQKMKGRIVYRGDCAKDEHGAAAVYQELGANPTSVQGLNACLAYGALPGNTTTAADAIKAYVQALLKSKHKTWIELPPELRPKWWRQKFVKPVVLLVRALYGHPDAGGLWEEHLKGVLKTLGGSEVQEYPGNFYFKDTGLLLSTYVDDLTLSGPVEQHKPFWDKLTKLVNVEPPEPIYRILGRNHVTIGLTKEGIYARGAAAPAHHALAFDMSDYAQQTVDLYKSIAKVDKLKPASTPFISDGAATPSDEDAKGELAPNACRILMKALWLGRLARPDIIKPINDLATKVQSWTKVEDKKVLRLIQYIDSTKHFRLVGHVNDNPEDLYLSLFADADFAGEKEGARSTSGGYLVLKGPNTSFPLAWLSKRQTSTSRSTTESEVISLAHSVFSEGIPALALWEVLLKRTVSLKIHEDNQATILVVRKGFSPKLRHISRTHKVNLGSLSEVIAENNVDLEYVDTNEQAADIFTKALPPHKWAAALALLGIRTDLPNQLEKP